MIGGLKLKVSFTYERSCFGYISSKYSSNNEQAQCMQVISKDKPTLLWVIFSSIIPEGHISCNPFYCKLLGLEEGVDVFVSPFGDVKVLDELNIDADSPDDQEILEHNSEKLQHKILDQLRLVVVNQKAVIWISPSLPIIFTPKQTGILVNESKIFVKIDAFNSVENTPQNIPANMPQQQKMNFKSIGDINNSLLERHFNKQKSLVLRALPIDSDGKKNLIHPYTVFLHEDLLDDKHKEWTVTLAAMTKIPFISLEKIDGDNNTNNIDGICVEIIPIDNVIYRSLCGEVYNKNIPTALIPKSLNVIINIENGMRLIFQMLNSNMEQPDHIDIVTYSKNVQKEIDVMDKFKKCVIDNTHSGKKFLINSNMVKKNEHITDGYVRFKLNPAKIKYTMLNSESFRNCTLSAKCLSITDLELPKLPISDIEYDNKNYCRTIKSFQEIVQNVILNINFEIHRDANFKGISEIKSNVLVTGPNGCGKTAICHTIQKEITMWSYVLNCRSLKGRKDLPEILGKLILMCQEHSPAVFMCDDFDALVPADTEGISSQDVAYFQRLAVSIKRMLQTCVGVCVVFTANSVNSLHPTLRSFGGSPLFTAQFRVPELDQAERTELLTHLLNDKIREELTVGEEDAGRMAMETAGCHARDLVQYFNRKIFEAVKKKTTTAKKPKPPLLEDEFIEEDKSRAFDIWGPVGGMDEVKRELTECIFWPLMYPALFPSRGCGVLLYGPPGSGKSHLGSCLSRLHHVSVLVVKGPELLSKYIGQSERAVRDVFDKAERQSPCILFFDEFDSLAPRRGHDSTGVTDRVVNQLLARLDGAEGPPKVPVLVATSRPDLLDPALLRAGRLERHIYCALPDENGRYEVLRSLSNSVCLAEGMDLRAVAARTAGFTPADLKALLVTAQLGRLEKQLVTNETGDLETVVVGAEDIDSALEETKPSLSPDQRIYYDTIYRKFRGEKLTPEQSRMVSGMERQRVTLA